MTTVRITPMPTAYRKISPKFRPCHPPIFEDGDPTSDDIAEARALFAELDEESKQWYGGRRGIFSDLECKPRRKPRKGKTA